MKEKTLKLSNRNTLFRILKKGKLYDMEKSAQITGYCVGHLRRLCHSQAVDHYRIVGRYYMSPKNIEALLSPVSKRRR